MCEPSSAYSQSARLVFRGTAEWSHCGAELTALMLLAAHACLASGHPAPFRQHYDCTMRQESSKVDLCCSCQYALLPATETDLSQR